jgi:hypothetical protein
MIALRHAHAALRQGETVWVDGSEPARVVSFLRRAAGEELLVVVNLSSRALDVQLELPPGPAFTEMTPQVPLPVQPGGAVPARTPRPLDWPTVALDAWGFRVFRRPAASQR